MKIDNKNRLYHVCVILRMISEKMRKQLLKHSTFTELEIDMLKEQDSII